MPLAQAASSAGTAATQFLVPWSRAGRREECRHFCLGLGDQRWGPGRGELGTVWEGWMPAGWLGVCRSGFRLGDRALDGWVRERG